MEAQRLSFGSHLAGGFSAVQSQKRHVVAVLSPPFSPSFQTRKWASIRSCSSVRPETLPDKGDSEFRSNVFTRGSLSSEKNDKRAVIRRKNLAVFVSGGGSNFKSIYEATLNGCVHGDVVVLVTNKKDCGGAEYARQHGIPIIFFPIKNEAYSADDLVMALRSFNVDFILLAGYLKIVPTEVIKAYPNSIVNIHPSLLPAFGGKGYYGMNVHKAVIASGARFSGVTIHYVDEEYDTGRIIAQRVVPVLATDTAEELAARVLHEEHKLYVEVSAALCDERIVWRDDGVPFIQSIGNPHQLL